ncbi:MAG: hypothetical protein ACXWT3_09530 [Methylococcaceae bacterium]
MTNPSRRTSGQRRNSFDAAVNIQEDDFILADLQVIPDDAELKIDPLNRWVDDEDAIDRLLVNTGFELDDDLEKTDDDSADKMVIEEIDLSDELQAFEQSSQPNADNFTVEPVNAELAKAAQTETSQASPPDFQVDNFISAYLAMRPDKQDSDEALSVEPIEEIESTDEALLPPVNQKSDASIHQQTDSSKLIAESGLEDVTNSEAAVIVPGMAALNQLKDEPAIFHRSRKNRLDAPAKTASIVYIVLGLAITALMASTVTLAFMVSDMKTEVTRLTGLLEIIKDDMAALEEKPSHLNNSRRTDALKK